MYVNLDDNHPAKCCRIQIDGHYYFDGSEYRNRLKNLELAWLKLKILLGENAPKSEEEFIIRQGQISWWHSN